MSIAYDVTLEIMQDDKRLASEFIALQVDNDEKKLLSDYTSVDPTYSDSEYKAVEARELKSGTLESNESITYSIRLWMDESVTSEDSMNRYFTSKVSVTATRYSPVYLANYIQTLATTDTTNLIYDDTTDKNLRYIGANPNNYLCFDEDCSTGKWRVIGLMNNMTTANGTQNLVKIIRADSVGDYAWDDSYNEEYSDNYGNNDWTAAALQTNLNSGDLYTTYIEKYNSLFETVTWNLGGVGDSDDWTASNMYTLERGTNVYTDRPTEWTEKIGLMYPSDYGYATSGGSTTDRTTCLATSLMSWYSYSDCYGSNYLFDSTDWQWTLTPYSDSSNYVLFVGSGGGVNYCSASFTIAVRPVGYLISNTKILSGNGSNETPWIIGA
jgi:hypothetical protein